MKKNNSKLKAAGAVVIAAMLLIAVNLCVSKLSEKLGLRLDMTGNKLYELSDETLNVLGELDMPVDIKVFSAEEDFTPLVAEVLRRYEEQGISILRTDRDGAIVFETDGEKLWLHTYAGS